MVPSACHRHEKGPIGPGEGVRKNTLPPSIGGSFGNSPEGYFPRPSFGSGSCLGRASIGKWFDSVLKSAEEVNMTNYEMIQKEIKVGWNADGQS